MNIQQLRKALESFDPDLPVWSEGCDCWGDVAGVRLEQTPRDEPPFVLLLRSEPGDGSFKIGKE